MAGTDKTKPKQEENSLPGVSPEIEAKVDKMMTGRSDTPINKSAPLLPGEKLPDFNQKPKDKAPEPPKPVGPKQNVPIEPGTTIQPDKPPNPPEDPATSKAVDEIVKEESDRMLAIEDAKAQLLAEGSAEIDSGFFNRLKSKIGGYLKSPKAWGFTFLFIILVVTIIGVIPTSRYFVLNTLGVRASASFRIIDNKTQQPLKNVEVSLDTAASKTDKNGNVKLEKIKLGPQQLTVKKPAFADLNEEVVIGWGSNPRGDVGLRAVGSRYTFDVVDFVSGKPIKGVEAVSGEASATADEKGNITLVVADQNENSVSVEIRADNYRSEKLTLEVGDKEVHHLKLVPSKKHAFVSKRSGKYDLYKVDVDGKNEKLVLAGTGAESEDTTIVMPSPDSSLVVYVANRGDRHGKDGAALSDLMIVNLDDNKVDDVDTSERIQPIGFIGSKLIYVKIADGEKDNSPNRNVLIAYDTETGAGKDLAKTNYFNDVISAKTSIYFAPAAYKVNGKVGLYKINTDGSSKITISNKEIWSLLRSSYDKISASSEQDWYEYDTNSQAFNLLDSAPPVQKSRTYVDSPDGKSSVWVDERDGKGVLLIYNVQTGEDKVLQTQSGLTNPVSWLDSNHLVYRVANGSETADYVISVNGGEPKKIRDVTNTAGLDRWYYY